MSMRSRTELMFQVVRERRMERTYYGHRTERKPRSDPVAANLRRLRLRLQ
jgi:hypothetical protein